MNQKEMAEIRRRFRAEKSDLVRIRGCYVNAQREIVSKFYQNIGMLSLMEADVVLSILRKTVSGTIGKHLIDIAFSNEQVLQGEEHRLLMALRKSALQDADIATAFYQRVIPSLTLDGSYLILLAYDNYGVPAYHKDGEKSEDSFEEFPFIVCSICPVRESKPSLSYYAYENRFRSLPSDNVVAAPELGFLFPAFDERTANIYNAVYYSRSTSESHQAFVDAVFNSPVPMPAAVQKETFGAILAEAISEDCSYEVAQTVHEQLTELIETHKANKETEPLVITKETVQSVLASCGVPAPRLAAFEEKFDDAFGPNAALNPVNIVDEKQFELRTPNISIKVSPERTDLVETRLIDGRKYILIRADDGVEVNGVSIRIR